MIVRSKASSKGTFIHYFNVGTSRGKKSVSAVGAFSTRRGVTTFTVK